MAKVFTRIGKEIVVAIKEGGTDPESNSKLRAVMQNAKAANMPKEIIERAIKKAKDKDTSSYKTAIFEGFAPHGVAVLVETLSDNHNRVVANVRAHFNKCNGSLQTAGSVAFMFDHTCQFKIEPADIDMEELELELIDYGAEEVFLDEAQSDEDQTGIMIYAAFEAFGKIQSWLEEQNHAIISSGFERLPQNLKETTEAQVPDVEKLLEKLEEDDDVQNVYHNMHTPA